jgi:hypothetical protein
LPSALVAHREAGEVPPFVEPSPRGWEADAWAQLRRRRDGDDTRGDDD